MFSKANSRFLTTANVLLLGQVVVAVIYLLFVLAQVIFPIGDHRVESTEWVRTLTTAVMGAVILGVINRKRGIFGVELLREEKLFRLVFLGVFDVAASVAVSYLLSVPLERTDLSVHSVLNSVASSAAVAVVFLVMLVLVPRMRVFRESFSKVLNLVILAGLTGLGWSTALLIGTLLGGPAGEADEPQAVFFQQLFRFALTAVFLAAVVVILVKNGEKMSGGQVGKQLAKRGQKVVQAETVAENQELRDEVEKLRGEVRELKEKLAGKKQQSGKKKKRK